MIKDFMSWFLLKPKLHNRNANFFFKEREVWWCSLGMNVGDEEDGKNKFFDRPILIVKKFNDNLFFAVPMTTKNKANRYYQTVQFQEKIVSIMLSHLRVIDKKRLQNKAGVLNKNDFEKVKENLKKLL